MQVSCVHALPFNNVAAYWVGLSDGLPAKQGSCVHALPFDNEIACRVCLGFLSEGS